MNTATNAIFLKEMGITEWASRDAAVSPASTEGAVFTPNIQEGQLEAVSEKNSYGTWWFFGNKPQGDAEVLFHNMIRALALAPSEWSWKNSADPLNALNC